MCTCESPYWRMALSENRCPLFRAMRPLLRQVLAEEREHLAPGVHRLLAAVERPVPIIEAVAGAVVAVEFVGLAVLLQRRLMLVHLLGARRAVVVAEDA